MGVTGLVFDVQRCSLHDGPGIRTTVFLKGCPLRCLWCHNPESQAPKAELSFNRERCAHCLACAQVCPHGAQQKNADGRHAMDHRVCAACGACVPVCQYDGLKMIGKEWSVQAVVAEVERDRAYYDRSGGGVTLSGGEPMAQFAFTRQLLRACKSRGIHTCVETCGHASQERYEQILADVDLWLLDYKETDPQRHRELTGAGNELILSNLAYLYERGAAIVLRCPLVSGVNDSPEHLRGIAALSRKYPKLLEVEIMAYHEMGRDKAVGVGREPALVDVKTTDEPTKARWVQALRELGCEKVVVG